MKKKKGRPSLSNLRKRNLEQQQQEEEETLTAASTPNLNAAGRRSKPNLNGITPAPDWISGNDDDDERKQKKVKLVVRLPSSNHNSPSLNSASCDGSDSNADGEKPQIDAGGDGSGDLSAAEQVEMVQKATDTPQGTPLESGPTTPLPDKKLLVFILDRLQKKDTHGVFSEPVDPNELPDYHEVIEHPMDFGTVRKKLAKGHYPNLDEFEADVFLICSNAMQYNAPDTVFFRHARSIQDLAKRDFENLRQVNDDGEPQPRIVRRGRPPGKNSKKPVGRPPFDRGRPESSSDATLATMGDNAIGSNSYNLRRGPMPSRFRSNDAFFGASHQSRNNETYPEWSADWNSEFPASILKAEAKHGKKQGSVDENRRATYRDFHPSAFGHDPSALTTLNGDKKQLMAVGLHSEHGYARSLARFAANLGPVVWKIASKKIERVLPTGEKFGPGWVGENEAPPQQPSALREQKFSNSLVHDGNSLGLKAPPMTGINSVVTYRSSLPYKEDEVEAVSGQNTNSESAVWRNGVGGIDPGRNPFQTQQKRVLQSERNGFYGLSGYDLSSQTGMVRVKLSLPNGQSGLEEASMPSQMLSRSSGLLTTPPPMAANDVISEPKLPGSSRSTHENVSTPVVAPDSHTAWHGGLPSQHRQYSLPVQPDLNVIFQAPGSPSSSFRVGSPQQPDLALQL